MNNSNSPGRQVPLSTKIIAGVIFLVLSVLLILVEYWHGNLGPLPKGVPGPPSNILWAFFPSCFFAISFLWLSVGLTHIRQEHIIWYKQSQFMIGCGNIITACLTITTFLINNKIIHLQFVPFMLILVIALIGAILCVLFPSIGANKNRERET